MGGERVNMWPLFGLSACGYPGGGGTRDRGGQGDMVMVVVVLEVERE